MSEPVHILSLGAGVQSSTLALMAAAGEVTPMPKAAVFADTQAEPSSVYLWLDWLETQLPFPVHRVSKGSLTKSITTLRPRKDGGHYVKSGIPAYTVGVKGNLGIIPRQCTWDYKIVPLDQASRRLGNIKRGQKTIGVIQWIGISLDEAIRMKPSRHKWAVHRWPLIEMGITRRKCLEWMESRGHPKPPRSACVYCPYHSNKEWRRFRDDEPEAFAEAIRVDKAFRAAKRNSGLHGIPYLHNSRVPLDEVDFRTEEDHGQQDMFGNECEGMCGV